MDTRGLALDQAPPLSVPLSWFWSLPLWLGLGGLGLLVEGGALLAHPWRPETIALAHLGSLGVLGAAMLGALHPLIAVLAGEPVRRGPWGRWLGLLWAVAVLGLGAGLAAGQPALVQAARLGLLLVLAGTVGPMLGALRRSRASRELRLSLALPLLALLGAASLGLLQAAGHAGGSFVFDRPAALRAHLALGLLGLVGGLVSAVSWPVLPMFYLARPVGRVERLAVATGIATGAFGPPAGLLLGLSPGVIGALASPGLLAVYLIHPLLSLRSLRARTRPRPDPSLRAWQAAMAGALLALPLMGAAVATESQRAALALGLLLLLGHGGLLVHGMLSRIVPFLLWLERWSPLVGQRPVPSMRSLLPDRLVEGSLRLHLLALGAGMLAALSGVDLLARLFGLLLVLLALALARTLFTPLRSRPAPTRGDAPR